MADPKATLLSYLARLAVVALALLRTLVGTRLGRGSRPDPVHRPAATRPPGWP